MGIVSVWKKNRCGSILINLIEFGESKWQFLEYSVTFLGVFINHVVIYSEVWFSSAMGIWQTRLVSASLKEFNSLTETKLGYKKYLSNTKYLKIK